MVNNIAFTLVIGSLLGFLAGIGVGGGSLLVLWLTAILGMPYAAARTINLLFFLPSALISTLFRWKEGTIQYKKVLPAILIGTAAAALFSLFSLWIDPAWLQKLFGLLLLYTGIKELFYRPRNAK